MIENTATVNFVIEGTKKNKDDKYPVKLKIYYKEGMKKYGVKEFQEGGIFYKIIKDSLKIYGK